MKKALTILSLSMAIAFSIISGTLALYTITLDDNFAKGSVVAKEFILTEDGSDTFEDNANIAPGETKEWKFAIKNHDGGKVSETAMDLDINIDVAAVAGKTAIAPLKVSVYDQNNKKIDELTGTGTINFQDEFALDEEGQTKTFFVKVEWPSNDEVDINYKGDQFGTALEVSVTGTQK